MSKIDGDNSIKINDITFTFTTPKQPSLSSIPISPNISTTKKRIKYLYECLAEEKKYNDKEIKNL